MPANPPTIHMLNVPNATASTALDTKTERATFVGVTVSTGSGNEWDFGEVDISAGDANSGVRHLLARCTNANGNTVIDNFKFWLSNEGFTLAGSKQRFAAISVGVGSPSNTQAYTQNAVVGSYSWADTPTPSEPGGQNVFSAADGASISIAGITPATEPSEVIIVAAYFIIKDEEVTGTYKGLDSGKELRGALKIDYS